MNRRYTSFKRVLTIGSLPLILSLLILAGCKEDDEDERVPRIQTDFTINLDLPEFTDLLNPGGWMTFSGGSRGVIIYRVNLDEFVAYDRHCTHNVPQGCRVNVEESGLTAKDEDCCGSVFDIFTGNAVEGPAQFPLQAFRTQFNPNNNTLRVFN